MSAPAAATILLVRHALALRRADWAADDQARPLAERGHRQAAALVEAVAGYDVRRVLSSPSVRCRQTVAPLATARGLAVEPDPTLAEGAAAAAAARIAEVAGAGRDGRATVLCSHGDVIPEVLRALDAGGTLTAGRRAQKGSTWVLGVGRDGRLATAHYLAPPA